MQDSLKINGLQVCYGKAMAVENISLQVKENSVTGIIGANGAGKSTILRAISGLTPLSGGEIWFHGNRIDALPAHRVVKNGVVQIPEGRKIFPHMTVIENIRIGAYLRKNHPEINNDIEGIFQRFPILADRINQTAGTLSGGEQQMLAIARALMAKPKLLLMDEPSWGLAPIVIEELNDIIKTLRNDGLTILLVEQNASMTFELTDHLYVLEVGCVTLEGKTSQIMKDKAVMEAFLG